MALFLSRHDNKVDRKGRVSVPAAFRAILSSQPFNGIFAFPSLTAPAIEGWGMDRMEALAASIDAMPPFSPRRLHLSNAILGRGHQLAFDSEGRIMLPQSLAEYASIGETATFVGMGTHFFVWQPEAYESHLADAVDQARAQADTLEWDRPGGTA